MNEFIQESSEGKIPRREVLKILGLGLIVAGRAGAVYCPLRESFEGISRQFGPMLPLFG